MLGKIWSLARWLVWDMGWLGSAAEDDGPAPDLMATLEKLAGVLRDLARFTKTTIDDRIAIVLQLALGNEVVRALIKKLLADPIVSARSDNERDAAIAGLAAVHEPELRPIVEAAGLSWSDFVAVLLQLVRYLLSSTGRRPWKMPWA